MLPDSLSPVYAAYIAVPLVTLVIGSALIYWIQENHWEKRGARSFVAVLLIGGVWLAFLLFHLLATDPFVQKVLVVAQGMLALCSIAAFGVFCSIYTGREYHRNRWVQAGLGATGVALFVGVVTNGSSHLVWTDLTPVTEPFPYVIIDLGPLTVAAVGVVILLNWYGWISLIQYMLTTGSESATQLMLVLAASLSVAVAQLVGMWGLLPADGLIHAAYGTLPFVVFATFGLFRYRLLETLPVARNAIVESLTDAIVILDAEHRIADVNRQALAIWPDLDEQIGVPVATACPELADRVDLTDATAATPSDSITLGVDGEERHFSVKTTTVTRGRTGDVSWYAILLRDVTELEQSRWQLEKQNQRLDQVAATVSHDLRNPISVADGHVHLAAELTDDLDAPADQRETLREHVDSAAGSLDRMQAIIDDLLTLAAEGKTVEETETVRLSAVAEAAWANVDTGEATLSVGEDRRLDADPSKLQSILENLVRNALDHGPDDVTIEITATAEGFAVRDDGPGIPDEEHDHVFEYGYTTSDHGTGLGLSIVKTMAESHGWAVGVEPDYDDGAGFVFDTVGSSSVGQRDRNGDSPA